MGDGGDLLNDIFSYVTVFDAVSLWAPIGSCRAVVDEDPLHLVHLAASDFVKLLVFLIYLDRIKSVWV